MSPFFLKKLLGVPAPAKSRVKSRTRSSWDPEKHRFNPGEQQNRNPSIMVVQVNLESNQDKLEQKDKAFCQEKSKLNRTSRKK